MAVISKEVFQHIRRIQIRTNRTVNDALAGAYHSVFKGRGMEFEDVRAYQPGDEIRSIDWNVTARMHYPFVKNFREERELTVMLVVDVSHSTHFGSHGTNKQELLAEIGAVLAFSAIRNNDKVGLILFSDQVELFIPPKKGVRHVLRVIRELLVFEGKRKGTHIGNALAYLSKVQRRQGVAFLLSDYLCPVHAREITLASKRHDLIGICLSDPHELALPFIGLAEIEDYETGERFTVDTNDPATRHHFIQAAEERLGRYQQTFSRAGSDFIRIRSDLPYVDPLRQFFLMRERRLS